MLALIVVLGAFVIIAISATVNRKRDVGVTLGGGRESTNGVSLSTWYAGGGPTATSSDAGRCDGGGGGGD